MKRKDKQQELTQMNNVAVFPKLLVIEVKVFKDGLVVCEKFLIPETLDLSPYHRAATEFEAL